MIIEKKTVPEKNLWDWLDLFIVSLVVALALFSLNTSQKKREDKRETEREAQEEKQQIDNQRQATLQDYYDKMSKLILEQKLGDEDNEDSKKAMVVARALTLSAFRKLNGKRNAYVLHFLSDAELFEDRKLLHRSDMVGINLSKADLRQLDLSEVDLRTANLSKAWLPEGNLRGAKLGFAKLHGADLTWAELEGADLSKADLREANVTEGLYDDATSWPDAFEAQEMGALFIGPEANLREAKLYGANLRGANLTWAKLEGADLSGVRYTTGTKWPYNFDPKAVGAILVDSEGNPGRKIMGDLTERTPPGEKLTWWQRVFGKR